MTLWRLLLVALAAAVPAAAEVVAVRSGEHPSFSRLVAKIRPGSTWDVRRDGRTVRVSVSAPGLVFDTRAVFERIPKSRLKEIVADPEDAALTLTLGCDCSVKAFVADGSYLVIDVADARPPGRWDRLARLPIDAGPYRFRQWQSRQRRVALGALFRSETGGELERVASRERPHVNDAPFPFELFPMVVKSAWRNRLIERMQEIARRTGFAVPKGGAQADDGMRRAGRVAQAVVEAPVPPEGDESGQVPASGRQPAENLRISIAGMREEGLLDAALQLDRPQRQGDPCAGEEFLEVSEWTSADGFADALAGQRSRLYGEFDRLNPEVGKGLAKAYLHFGFGAEAEQVLAILPEADDEIRLLRKIARIMDAPPKAGDEKAPSKRFATADCSDNVTFWQSLLADAPVGQNAGEKIARAFLALPVHLRAYLGPRVVRLLVADNRLEPARIVSRSWERAARGAMSKTGSLFLPDLTDSENETEADRGADIPRMAGAPETPYRLLDMVARNFRVRESLPREVPDLVASYALEYRRTELGDALAEAHVIALALNGRFDEAFSLAGREARERAARDRGAGADTAAQGRMPGVTARVLTLLTEKADDITFLRHVLKLADSGAGAGTAGLSAEVSEAVARRLRDLGFAEEARVIAVAGPVPDT